jgi:hypothetical protein
MKATGFLLISAGFLAGSLVAVQTEANQIDWRWFLPAFTVGVVGVVLARRGHSLQSRDADTLSGNVDQLTASIDRIVQNITRLCGESQQMHPYEVHGRIDQLFPQDLNSFVEARLSIAHVYSLPAYADVMNEFAAGERYLNRVWSASVDCYIDDVNEYLQRAQHQFQETRRKLRALREQEAGAGGAGT